MQIINSQMQGAIGVSSLKALRWGKIFSDLNGSLRRKSRGYRSLKLTAKAPENRPKRPKRKVVFQHLSTTDLREGKLLVSARAFFYLLSCPPSSSGK